jgi:hypothetical protein
MEDESFMLSFEGAVDVARWSCAAWESGHFDWNLLAGDCSQECIDERWAVVRWLNEMNFLACLDVEDSEDREISAALMFAFVTANLREVAERENVTPQDYMDLAMNNAELLEEMS